MDSDNQSLKKCSYCNEEIPAGAGRCPFCGSLLEDSANDASAPVNIPADTGAQAEESANRPDNTPAGYRNNQGYSYNNPYGYREYKRQPLSNGLKVFLTVIFTLIPGIGQLAGIITAIVFMNIDDDPDRKSFGVAILVASLVMFGVACIGCFILAVAVSMTRSFSY